MYSRPCIHLHKNTITNLKQCKIVCFPFFQFSGTLLISIRNKNVPLTVRTHRSYFKMSVPNSGANIVPREDNTEYKTSVLNLKLLLQKHNVKGPHYQRHRTLNSWQCCCSPGSTSHTLAPPVYYYASLQTLGHSSRSSGEGKGFEVLVQDANPDSQGFGGGNKSLGIETVAPFPCSLALLVEVKFEDSVNC